MFVTVPTGTPDRSFAVICGGSVSTTQFVRTASLVAIQLPARSAPITLSVFVQFASPVRVKLLFVSTQPSLFRLYCTATISGFTTVIVAARVFVRPGTPVRLVSGLSGGSISTVIVCWSPNRRAVALVLSISTKNVTSPL